MDSSLPQPFTSTEISLLRNNLPEHRGRLQRGSPPAVPWQRGAQPTAGDGARTHRCWGWEGGGCRGSEGWLPTHRAPEGPRGCTKQGSHCSSCTFCHVALKLLITYDFTPCCLLMVSAWVGPNPVSWAAGPAHGTCLLALEAAAADGCVQLLNGSFVGKPRPPGWFWSGSSGWGVLPTGTAGCLRAPG